MTPLFESLEGRNLFSATPIAAPTPPQASISMSFAPLAVLQKMVGTWKGTVYVAGVHSQPVKLIISSQTSTGKITGVLKSTKNSSINVAFTGKVKASGSVSISLLGGHSGGAINGTGSGKLKASATKISFTMAFVQGGRTFPGTLTLKKIA